MILQITDLNTNKPSFCKTSLYFTTLQIIATGTFSQKINRIYLRILSKDSTQLSKLKHVMRIFYNLKVNVVSNERYVNVFKAIIQ